MRRLTAIRAAALATAILLTGTACAGGSKAGGVEERAKVLRLVSFNSEIDLQLQLFGNAVDRESHGALRLEIATSGRGDPEIEKKTIATVRAGKAELGMVPARAWEEVGIDSFRALVAPFLIDSYPLEQRVLSNRLARQMLGSLHGHGLVGLALLPGPMRRVAGRRPLLRPADFAGISFATTPTATAEATVRALGATSAVLRPNIPWSALPKGLGGLESQLSSIAGNQYFRAEPYLTENLTLWPRPLVVFASAKVYRSLSGQQRLELQRAARDALVPSMHAVEVDDEDAVGQLCRASTAGSDFTLRLARASDLLALRHAVAPVYRMLERDQMTRSFIAQIGSLKRQLNAPADTGRACPHQGIAQKGRGLADGVYRMHVAAEQVAKVDHVPVSQATPENWGDFVLVIERGRFAFTQENARACTWQYGTLTLKRTEMDWRFTDGGGIAPTNSENKPGEFFVWRWSLYRNALNLKAITPTDLAPETWQRTSTVPSAKALSSRCPPPKKAFP